MQTFDHKSNLNTTLLNVYEDDDQLLIGSNRYYKEHIEASVRSDSMSITDDGATTVTKQKVGLRILKNK